MKKVFVVLVVLLLSASFAVADELAIGLRGSYLGSGGGASLRFEKDVEAILGVNVNGFTLIGLWENHYTLTDDVPDLTWFWGIGGHLGLYDSGENSPGLWTNLKTNIGLDAIAGLEYSFASLIDVPLSLSIDYKPALNILGGLKLNWLCGAFTLRYTF
ncbi:MAG: hypothetical protein WCT23_09270 [Candidatus Neomarinimicrobiota bacterium]